MHISEISEKDIPAISNLYISVFRAPPWNEEWNVEWAIDRLQGIYNSPGFYGFLYKENSNPIAALLGRSLTFKDWREFEIVELFVDSQHQGNGIGTELVKYLESFLKQKGYFKTTLLTAKETQVEEFYVKNGFKTSKRMIYMSHEL